MAFAALFGDAYTSFMLFGLLLEVVQRRTDTALLAFLHGAAGGTSTPLLCTRQHHSYVSGMGRTCGTCMEHALRVRATV